MLDFNCIDVLLTDILNKDITSLHTILMTIFGISSNEYCKKKCRESDHFASSIYEIFKCHPQFSDLLCTIAINTFNHNDISLYALPMLDICKISNPISFDLFFQIFKTERSNNMKLNDYIYDNLNSLLLTSYSIDIQSGLYRICCLNTPLSNTLNIGLWKSKCRETLINIASTEHATSQNQIILFNITSAAQNSTIWNLCPLNSDEIKYILRSLDMQNCYVFGVYMITWYSSQIKLNDMIVQKLIRVVKINPDRQLRNNIFCLIFTSRDSIKLTDSTLDILKNIKQLNLIDNILTKINSKEKLKSAMDFCEKIEINMDVWKDKYNALCKKEQCNFFLKKNGILLDIPNDFKCPITQELMRDPIVASDGFSYEREAFIQFLKKGLTKSPLTREKLNNTIYVSNINLKKRIRDYEEDICKVISQKKDEKQI